MSFKITITLTFLLRSEDTVDTESYERVLGKRADHAPKFDHVLKQTLDGDFDDDIVSKQDNKSICRKNSMSHSFFFKKKINVLEC